MYLNIYCILRVLKCPSILFILYFLQVQFFSYIYTPLWLSLLPVLIQNLKFKIIPCDSHTCIVAGGTGVLFSVGECRSLEYLSCVSLILSYREHHCHRAVSEADGQCEDMCTCRDVMEDGICLQTFPNSH